MRYLCTPDDDDFDFDDAQDADQDDALNEEEDQEDDSSNDPEGFAPEDLPEIDNDVYASAEDFPNAADVDFEDDEGGWSTADYQQSAQNIFSDHPFFGDTLAAGLSEPAAGDLGLS